MSTTQVPKLKPYFVQESFRHATENVGSDPDDVDTPSALEPNEITELIFPIVLRRDSDLWRWFIGRHQSPMSEADSPITHNPVVPSPEEHPLTDHEIFLGPDASLANAIHQHENVMALPRLNCCCLLHCMPSLVNYIPHST